MSSRRSFYFGKERGEVAPLEVGVKESAVEIAVIADCRTKRNVNVEAEH
jgi:hypothetical protein